MSTSDEASSQDFEAREATLRAEVDALRARVAQLERELAASRKTGDSFSAQPSTAPSTVHADGQAIAPSSAPPRTAPPIASVPTQSSTPRPTPPVAPREQMSLEVFIGRRVVPLVGALAVLLAVGFLVHYAIQLGFFGQLPPSVRFALGIAIGAALLGAGEVVRRRGAPGAAVGLDAAGLGSLLVTCVIGVYGLELFGKGTGALVACSAGLFGVWWSLRTQSVVVGVVAVVALFGAPVGFDQFRESALLAGLQLTLAIGAGCAMHLLGPPRFEAIRLLALVLALPLGAATVASAESAAMSAGFVAVWWAAFATGSSIAAIRGRSRGVNEAVLVLTSLAVLVTQLALGAFGPVVGVVAFANPAAWLAVGVGSAMVAQALFLRSFDVAREAGTDPESVALREGSRTCAGLAAFAEPLAAILILAGASAFVDSRAIAPMWAAGAVFCGWIGSRRRAIGLELVAPIAVLPTTIAALASMQWAGMGGGASAASVSIPVPWGQALELRATPEIAIVLAIAAMLFAAPGLRARRLPQISWCVLAGAAWIAASLACSTTSAGFLLLSAIPAIAIGFWRTAPTESAATGLVGSLAVSAGLLLRALLVLGAGTDHAHADEVFIHGLASVLAATAIHLAVTRPLFAPIRVPALAAGYLVAGMLLVALLSLAAHAAEVGVSHIGLFVVVACSSVAIALLVVAMALRRMELAFASWALGAMGVLGGTIAGMWVLFSSPATEHGSSRALSAATAICLFILLAVAMGATRVLGAAAALRATTLAVAGVAAVPLGALLLSSVSGAALAAPVAAGWVLVVGVAELAVGFRRRIAPLRWAGLVSFTLLVLRLYLVDLAGTPLLVRIALLFVSGMVLVATGIVYARGLGRGTPQAPAASAPDTEPPSRRPPPPPAANGI